MVKLTTNVIDGRSNPRLESFVQDRVDLVMGKFENRIESMTVRFKDETHKKISKKVCMIEVRLSPRGRVRVSAKKENAFAAVHAAVHSAELQVCRDLDRHQRGNNLRHRRKGLRQENRQWADQLAATP
ncbi:HPF/RaiA family ribosome-associated protein [Planctomycetota bacterium]